MDFLDILDFVAFDLEAAMDLIEQKKKAVAHERLEEVQPEPVRKECGGLCGAGCSCSAWPELGTVILVVM